MVTDEDILEKDDMHILDRMKAFVVSEEVSRFGAAKPLSAQIERAVCQSSQYTFYVT
jgi:son of sevenless